MTLSSDVKKEKKGCLIWLWLSVVIFALDQLTKWLAVYYLDLYQVQHITRFFNIHLAFNEGAAFSFLSTVGGWQKILLSLLAAVVSLFITIWLYRLPRHERWTACALSLVLSGAVGNLWDRLTLGHVVDFIQLHYQSWYWPTFNIADIAICIGAVMLVLDALVRRKTSKQVLHKVN
jgi:signal peptidase II